MENQLLIESLDIVVNNLRVKNEDYVNELDFKGGFNKFKNKAGEIGNKVKSGVKTGYGKAKEGVRAGYGKVKSGVQTGYGKVKSGVQNGAGKVGAKWNSLSKRGKIGAAVGAATLAGAGAYGIHKLRNRNKHESFLGEKDSVLGNVAKGIGASAAMGAGIGGAMKLAGKGVGVLKGAKMGLRVGSIASLLLAGGAGIYQLVKKAMSSEDAQKVKSSIRRAIESARDNDDLGYQEKAAIARNGEAAIAKINQVSKSKRRFSN